SNAKVIALANGGGDTINAIRQAAGIGVSPRSQPLAPLLVYISDIHALGLDITKGMTFIDGFYWDRAVVQAFLRASRCEAYDGPRRGIFGSSPFLAGGEAGEWR